MRSLICILILIAGFTKLQSQAARHAVKLNLLPLAVKTISTQYEYSLTSKKSILCQVGYTFPAYLLERYYDKYKEFDTRKIIFRDLKFNGGFQVTPEFRYYVMDKENSGFYIGTYLRYSRYSVTSRIDYTDNNFNVGFTFKGTFTTTNIGFNTGYQWVVGDHFIIDWWLLSGHVGVNKFKLKAHDEFEFANKPAFLEDLEKTLEGIPLVRNFGSDIADRDMKVGFGYSFFGTRMGFCLGYKF